MKEKIFFVEDDESIYFLIEAALSAGGYEKKGFVERHIDKGDKRQMFFLLTERGKGKLRSIKENPIAVPHLLQSIL